MIDFATDDLEELSKRFKEIVIEFNNYNSSLTGQGMAIDLLIATCIVADEFDVDYNSAHKFLQVLEDTGVIQIYDTAVCILN
jgi:hypothetical protein